MKSEIEIEVSRRRICIDTGYRILACTIRAHQQLTLKDRTISQNRFMRSSNARLEIRFTLWYKETSRTFIRYFRLRMLYSRESISLLYVDWFKSSRTPPRCNTSIERFARSSIFIRIDFCYLWSVIMRLIVSSVRLGRFNVPMVVVL